MIIGSIKAFALDNAVSEAQKPPEKVEQQVENPAAAVGAQTYVKLFTKEYLTWEVADYQERSERLAPFLREGTDEQAGLQYDGLEYNSKPGTIEIWTIEETGKDTATITVKASQNLYKKVEKKEKDKVKEEIEEKGPFTQYIKIPVIAKENSYLINGLPTFTNTPKAPTLEPKEEVNGEPVTDSQTSESAKEFLNTFLKVYTTGTNEELTYYTSDEKVRSLESSIVFKSIDEVKIYQGKGKTLEAHVTAVFTEPNSKGQFLQSYKLQLEQKDQRWLVNDFSIE